MNIYINKGTIDEPRGAFKGSYTINITNRADSTIKTNIKDVWFDLGCLQIDSSYEDFYIIALTVFAIDKRFPRRHAYDRWTREFNVSIPVLNIQRWNSIKAELEKLLRYLSGDIWVISFRESTSIYCKDTNKMPPPKIQNKYNCVCLFSAGLDSFCGAVKLLEEGISTCFVGYQEYPKIERRQGELYNALDRYYPNHDKKLLNFTAKPHSPIYNGQISKEEESTSRSRSLLFIAAALSFASILGTSIPLYVPENGFIGLNIPLTNSRRGSCSTRTTHPYFLRNLQLILNKVGIHNEIRNFYSFSSKKDVVNSVKDTQVFREYAEKTVSCSHPCLPRWSKNGNREYPQNCGYCYPCIIRKSSVKHLNLQNDKYTVANSLSLDFLERYSNFADRASDVRAILSMIHKYKDVSDGKLRSMINCTGELELEDMNKFIKVYRDTINDLLELVNESDEMKGYLGIDVNEQAY